MIRIGSMVSDISAKAKDVISSEVNTIHNNVTSKNSNSSTNTTNKKEVEVLNFSTSKQEQILGKINAVAIDIDNSAKNRDSISDASIQIESTGMSAENTAMFVQSMIDYAENRIPELTLNLEKLTAAYATFVNVPYGEYPGLYYDGSKYLSPVEYKNLYYSTYNSYAYGSNSSSNNTNSYAAALSQVKPQTVTLTLSVEEYEKMFNKYFKEKNGYDYDEYLSKVNTINTEIAEIKATKYSLDQTKKELPYMEIGETEEYKKFAEKFNPDTSFPTETVEQMVGACQTQRIQKVYVNPAGASYEYLTEDDKIMYSYLYYNEGKDAANNYLKAIQDRLNQRKGQKEAEEYLKTITDENGEIRRDLITGVITAEKGFFDGVETFGEGLENVFATEAMISDNQYAQMYILNALGKEGILDDVYQLGSTFGNMAPSMLMSAVSNVLLPGSGAVIGSTMMGLSSGGNSLNQALIDGNDLGKSRIYGALSGMSETTLGYFLGNIPLLNTSAGFSIKGLLKEGGEELLQEYVDAGLRAGILGETIDFTQLNEDAWKSFIYGIIVSGVSTGTQVVGKMTIYGRDIDITSNNDIIDLFNIMNSEDISIKNQKGTATFYIKQNEDGTIDNNLANKINKLFPDSPVLEITSDGKSTILHVDTVSDTSAIDSLNNASIETITTDNSSTESTTILENSSPNITKEVGDNLREKIQKGNSDFNLSDFYDGKTSCTGGVLVITPEQVIMTSADLTGVDEHGFAVEEIYKGLYGGYSFESSMSADEFVCWQEQAIAKGNIVVQLCNGSSNCIWAPDSITTSQYQALKAFNEQVKTITQQDSKFSNEPIEFVANINETSSNNNIDQLLNDLVININDQASHPTENNLDVNNEITRQLENKSPNVEVNGEYELKDGEKLNIGVQFFADKSIDENNNALPEKVVKIKKKNDRFNLEEFYASADGTAAIVFMTENQVVNLNCGAHELGIREAISGVYDINLSNKIVPGSEAEILGESLKNNNIHMRLVSGADLCLILPEKISRMQYEVFKSYVDKYGDTLKEISKTIDPDGPGVLYFFDSRLNDEVITHDLQDAVKYAETLIDDSIKLPEDKNVIGYTLDTLKFDEISYLKEKNPLLNFDMVPLLLKEREKLISKLDMLAADKQKTLKELGAQKEVLEISNEMQNTANTLADNVRNKATLIEPKITNDMQLLQTDETYLAGLNFKLKSFESLSRKILTDSKIEGISLENAASNIGDSIRYTLIAKNQENYTKVVTESLNTLLNKGYKIKQNVNEKGQTKTKFKNSWGNSIYQGINVSMLSPGGDITFELQIHTEQSFYTKEKLNHLYYEIYRNMYTTQDETNIAKRIMEINQSLVYIPPNALNLKID